MRLIITKEMRRKRKREKMKKKELTKKNGVEKNSSSDGSSVSVWECEEPVRRNNQLQNGQ